MFSKNNFFTLFFCLFLATTFSQIKIGTSYGYNFDFGNNVHKKKYSQFEFQFIYKSLTKFNPLILINFTKTPLNFNRPITNNQGSYKTIAINNVTNIEIGLESKLKEYMFSNINAKFGIGITILNNPVVFIENSNTAYGYNTTYNTKKGDTNFIFLDFSTSFKKKISENWELFFELGTIYYPQETFVSVIAQKSSNIIEASSTFTKLRPYVKSGVFYSFK